MSGQDLKGELKNALCEARDSLEEILNEARTKLEKLGASKFINDGVGVLAAGINTYANLFIRTGMEDRQTLDAAVGKSSHAVREAGNRLHDTEDEWNEFIGEIEISESQKEGSLISVGADIPTRIKLKHINLTRTESTGSETTLGELLTGTRHPLTLLVLNRHFA